MVPKRASAKAAIVGALIVLTLLQHVFQGQPSPSLGAASGQSGSSRRLFLHKDDPLLATPAYNSFTSEDIRKLLVDEHLRRTTEPHPICNDSLLRRWGQTLGTPPLSGYAKGKDELEVAVVGLLGTAPGIPVNPRLAVDMLANFHTVDEHFFSHLRYDFILFYQFDAELEPLVLRLIDTLNWTKVGVVSGAEAVSIPGRYATPRNSTIIIKGRDFPLPRFIHRNPAILDNPAWMTCGNMRRTVSYNMYSGAAFSHHLLLDPVLDAYDYVFKLDTDVQFFEPAPFDIAKDMQRRECVFAHSQIEGGSDCSLTGDAALLQYGKILGQPARSINRDWCKGTDVIGPSFFYGNFLGGPTELLRSTPNLLLSTWLYECHEGYFKYRWGDQTPYPLFLCNWFDLPDLQNQSSICDYSEWRKGGVFRHA